MGTTYDLVVVGVGAMGSACLWRSAVRGLRVLGIEQFGIPHALGSSHGGSRMIRMAYFEHPDYVPLLRRAYELWGDLESVAGERLFHRTGGIYMGPENGDVVAGTLRAARQHQLGHESLSREELRHRYGMFELPAEYVGVWEPAAGFLLPERCVSVMTQQTLEHGADIHAHDQVLAWDERAGHILVRTTRGDYEAGAVVFTAGPWTDRLLRDLRVPLVVTRQVMGWVWPAGAERFRLGTFPVWGVEQPDGSLAYGFPIHGDGVGMKVARHGRGEVTAADSLRREIDERDLAELTGIVRRWMPRAQGPVTAAKTCLYTNSPDGHFLIDRVPGHDRAFFAAGFSGHGFKFASVVGEILAGLVASGRSDLPAGFLSLSRFPNRQSQSVSGGNVR